MPSEECAPRSAAVPADTARRPRVAKLAGVGVATLGLVAGGAATAVAATRGHLAGRALAAHDTRARSADWSVPGPGGFGRPAVVGTVASVGSNSFAVTARDGSTVTVNVTSSTKYLDPALGSPSFSNVTKNAVVAVFGTRSSGIVSATTVAIGIGDRFAGPGGFGRPDWGHGSGISRRAPRAGLPAQLG